MSRDGSALGRCPPESQRSAGFSKAECAEPPDNAFGIQIIRTSICTHFTSCLNLIWLLLKYLYNVSVKCI